MHFAKCIVDLDQRLERLGKSERLGLVSSRKPRRLVSVSSRTKFSMSWSRLGLGHLGLVSRLGLGVKGLVDIPASCNIAITTTTFKTQGQAQSTLHVMTDGHV